MNLVLGKDVVEDEAVHTSWREFGLYNEGNGKCVHFFRKVRAPRCLWEEGLSHIDPWARAAMEIVC